MTRRRPSRDDGVDTTSEIQSIETDGHGRTDEVVTAAAIVEQVVSDSVDVVVVVSLSLLSCMNRCGGGDDDTQN